MSTPPMGSATPKNNNAGPIFFADSKAAKPKADAKSKPEAKPASPKPAGSTDKLSEPVTKEEALAAQSKIGSAALKDLNHLTVGAPKKPDASKTTYKPTAPIMKPDQAKVVVKEPGGPGASLDQIRWASGTKTVRTEKGDLVGFKVNDKLFSKLPPESKNLLIADFKKQLGVPKEKNMKSESKDGVTFYSK